MGKIRITPDEPVSAAEKFFNLSVKTYLASTAGAKLQVFSDCIHSESIPMYVTDMKESQKNNNMIYEVVALDGDKVHCFQMQVDANLNVKKVREIPELKLSSESKTGLDDIKQSQVEKPRNNSPLL